MRPPNASHRQREDQKNNNEDDENIEERALEESG